MKKFVISFLAISIFCLSGCLGGGKYKIAKYRQVEVIPDGKALVYIYRPYKFAGSALHYTVNINEEKVSDVGLYNNGYLIYYANPGKCVFWTQVYGERFDAIVNAEAGRTYYIQVKYGELELVPPGIGKENIKKCELLSR